MQDAITPSTSTSADNSPAQVNAARPGPFAPVVAKPASARWRRPGAIALALGASALLAFGAYYAWQTWVSPGSSASPVLTAVATRGNLEDTVTATGTLQPKDFVDVGTQVSGQLKKLHVDIGAIVKAKDLLAEIDPSVYQAKVDGDQAQLLNQHAQLADKQAQLALAELQLTRRKT